MTRALLAVAAAALALPAAASAQGGPGFLFREPTVTVKFETGYALQLTNSDIFGQTRNLLTVGRRDFDAPYVGGEIAVRVNDQWDVAFGVGWNRSSILSEYADWVDQDDLPIEQTTEFRVVPISLSAKYYLRSRGRRVGQFAWVPTAFSPYVGAGTGVVNYRFQQVGDFIDVETLEIFFDRLNNEGQSWLLRGLAGVAVSLGKQFELTAEARYDYATADMKPPFDAFDAMDLSGIRGVVGLAVRF